MPTVRTLSMQIEIRHTLKAIAGHVPFAAVRRVAARAVWMLAMVFAFTGCFASFASAQAANFVGTLTTLPIYGIATNSVAVDGSGNVYICETSTSQVFKETLSAGSYTQSLVPTPSVLYPESIAVDGSGNLYVGDGENEVFKYTLSGGTYTEKPITNTVFGPYGIAVDGSGNLYISDYGNHRIVKETLSAGVYTQTTIASSSGSGAYSPLSIAVDSSGNVYFSATQGGVGYLLKLTVSGSSYTQSTLLGGFENPLGIAVDQKGNIYIADSFGNAVYEALPVTGGSYTLRIIDSELSSPLTVAVDKSGNLYFAADLPSDAGTNHVLELTASAGNFGSVNVGNSASTPVEALFAFDSTTTLGSIPVLTEGATGLDFANYGTGTCSVGATYQAAQTCTVDVSFASTLAGVRHGAAELSITGGLVLASGYVEGIGVAPQLAFLPGIQSSIGVGLSGTKGVAVDGSGNVYIADSVGEQVLMETVSGNTYSQEPIGSGFYAPGALAVDGAGNIYVADYTAGVVYMESPVGTLVYQSTVVSGLSHPTGVAVDASGNVYIVNAGTFQVFKETLSDGSYTKSVIGTGLIEPYGVAVDGNGNVFISDPGNTALFKETPSGSGYNQTQMPGSFQTPEGVSVDGFGNVFVADAGLQEVFEEQLVGGNYYLGGLTTSGIAGPADVAVDGAGNVYIADDIGNKVWKEDYASPPSLNFPTATNVGSTDTADGLMSVIVENLGNAPLILPVLSGGNNPGIPTSFTLDAAVVDACPVVAPGSSSSTIAAGSFCQLAIGFNPTVPGSVSGTLVLTDTNLNTYYATQSISLHGTGVGTLLSQTISFPAITATEYPLSQLPLAATATSGLTVGFASTTPSVCTVSSSTASLIASGTCTIVASQAGGSGYKAAASVTQSFTVHHLGQTITFAAIANQLVGAPLSLTATATSGLAVNFVSTTSSVCTVSGSTVSLLTYGTCTIDASQAGNSVYSAAVVYPRSFAVNLAQTITFPAITTTEYALSDLTLSATATSGLTVSFASTTPTVCTVSGDTASLLTPGTCILKASQAGNSQYGAAATVTQGVTVHHATQTITFAPIATQLIGIPLDLTATAASGATVGFASITPSVCTVSGTTASFLAVGQCSIEASQSGTSIYSPAPIVERTFSARVYQSITFAPITTTEYALSKLTVAPTASSNLAVTLSSITPTVCTVSGFTATLIASGTCTLRASQAGNGTYIAAASVNQGFLVHHLSQTISFAAIPSQVVGTPLTLTATSTSALAVSFASITPTICTVSGNKATMLAAGTCSIEASQLGNSIYSPAAVIEHTFTVAQ